MPRKYAGTSHTELYLAMSLWALACGPTDGDIGTLATTAPPRAPTFEEQFANPATGWSTLAPVPGASAGVGIESTDASDGRVARLIFAGHPEYSASDRTGAEYRTELLSEQRFGYGIHRSRVSFGSCGTNQEVVQAVLGYFGDRSDRNGNGIEDEIEIDFQVLCGEPNLAYLTVFTDYQVTETGAVLFRKLSHVVDFSSGRYYDTPFDDQDTFTLSGTDDSLAIPDMLRADTFYELGFEWHEGSIRFFLDVGEAERTLWTLADPTHVPTTPVQIVYNLWHADSHWFPRDGLADYPEQDVTMLVDWFRYYGE